MSWAAVEPAAKAALTTAIMAAMTPGNTWPQVAQQIAEAIDTYTATLLSAAEVTGSATGVMSGGGTAPVVGTLS